MPGVSAVLARHVVYPLQERALKRPTFDYLADLESSQWRSRDEIEELQRRKLIKLLRVALAHCPWHAERLRAAGLDRAIEDGELTLADLARLPTMTKEDAREHGEKMRWSGVPGGA